MHNSLSPWNQKCSWKSCTYAAASMGPILQYYPPPETVLILSRFFFPLLCSMSNWHCGNFDSTARIAGVQDNHTDNAVQELMCNSVAANGNPTLPTHSAANTRAEINFHTWVISNNLFGWVSANSCTGSIIPEIMLPHVMFRLLNTSTIYEQTFIKNQKL